MSDQMREIHNLRKQMESAFYCLKNLAHMRYWTCLGCHVEDGDQCMSNCHHYVSIYEQSAPPIILDREGGDEGHDEGNAANKVGALSRIQTPARALHFLEYCIAVLIQDVRAK